MALQSISKEPYNLYQKSRTKSHILYLKGPTVYIKRAQEPYILDEKSPTIYVRRALISMPFECI